ncbi:helix-turn-helix domain-containing protein [Bacillus nakamurai]|uniref:helix-turn-helix domain-containing protein n=1 Tax=Bacillus nakamurai TaxID=1793963 RepID=UPI00281662B6|nr:helix-turn-helix domain-containing protein [Bacillus nakamurai]
MLELLCKSLDYIEANLDQDMTIEDIAQSAHSSKFHYQRLFLMLTGSTVSEYIRKRKLTVAAQELAVHQTKVIDTAMKYGYDTRNHLPRPFANGMASVRLRQKNKVPRFGLSRVFPFKFK